jgi:hypothetical protein
MMLIFAFLTLGYFAGVVTALVIFPPRVTELKMQEEDAAKPVEALLNESKQAQISPTVSEDLRFEVPAGNV